MQGEFKSRTPLSKQRLTKYGIVQDLKKITLETNFIAVSNLSCMEFLQVEEYSVRLELHSLTVLYQTK